MSMTFIPEIPLRWVGTTLLAVITVGSVGCGPQTFHDADALYVYVYSEDYPAKATASREGVTAIARYLPTSAVMVNDYRAAERMATEIRADSSLNDAQRAQRIESLARSLQEKASAYDELVYFNVTLGLQSGEDIVYAKLQRQGFRSYSAWLETLLFGIEEHLVLREGALELEPSGYLLDRTYGMSPTRTLLVSFPRAQLQNGRVELRLAEFGLGTGTLTFSLDVRRNDVTYIFSS